MLLLKKGIWFGAKDREEDGRVYRRTRQEPGREATTRW